MKGLVVLVVVALIIGLVLYPGETWRVVRVVGRHSVSFVTGLYGDLEREFGMVGGGGGGEGKKRGRGLG